MDEIDSEDNFRLMAMIESLSILPVSARTVIKNNLIQCQLYALLNEQRKSLVLAI